MEKLGNYDHLDEKGPSQDLQPALNILVSAANDGNMSDNRKLLNLGIFLLKILLSRKI